MRMVMQFISRLHSSTQPRPTETDFFVLMLSGGGAQGQSIQYACCMKAWIRIQYLNGKRVDMDVPICYCIITQVPFIPFFKNVLQQLLGSLLFL